MRVLGQEVIRREIPHAPPQCSPTCWDPRVSAPEAKAARFSMAVLAAFSRVCITAALVVFSKTGIC